MAEKPNLIFILPDRMRRDAMTAYGSEWIESPHLDQLAADSFVFERAYVTQPVCAPSRASLLTGLYPQASGVRVNGDDLPVDVPVITEMLPEGYRTGYFGKWHLGDDFTRQRGFDEWVSVKAWMVKWTNEENALTRSDYYSYLSDRGLSPSEEVRRNRLRATPTAPPSTPNTKWLPISAIAPRNSSRQETTVPLCSSSAVWNRTRRSTAHTTTSMTPTRFPTVNHIYGPHTTARR